MFLGLTARERFGGNMGNRTTDAALAAVPIASSSAVFSGGSKDTAMPVDRPKRGGLEIGLARLGLMFGRHPKARPIILERPDNASFSALVNHARLHREPEAIDHACMEWAHIVINALFDDAIEVDGNHEVLIVMRALRPALFDPIVPNAERLLDVNGTIKVLLYGPPSTRLETEGANAFKDIVLGQGGGNAPEGSYLRYLPEGGGRAHLSRSFIVVSPYSYRDAYSRTPGSAANRVVFNDRMGARQRRALFNDLWCEGTTARAP